MKKIYLCHEYGGVYDYAKEIADHIKMLITYNKFASYISPVLSFGMLHDRVDSELYSEYCLSLLKDCNMMIIFEDKSKTEQCLSEIEYCRKHNIPVIEYVDYCKRYFKPITENGVEKNVFSKQRKPYKKKKREVKK